MIFEGGDRDSCLEEAFSLLKLRHGQVVFVHSQDQGTGKIREDPEDAAEEGSNQNASVRAGVKGPTIRVVDHDDGYDLLARNRGDEVYGRGDDLGRGARVCDLLTEDVHPVAAGPERRLTLLWRDEA